MKNIAKCIVQWLCQMQSKVHLKFREMRLGAGQDEHRSHMQAIVRTWRGHSQPLINRCFCNFDLGIFS